MLDQWYIIGVTVMLFAVVFVGRALPFIFGKRLTNSPLLTYLSTRLPMCIIILLTLYYMVLLAKPTHWHNLPWQLIALVVVIALHWRWKNVIISVLGGTAVYLALSML